MPYLPDDRSADSALAVLQQRFLSRSETWQTLKKTARFDVIVVGGGIHGAEAARLAAFNGLKVALFERDDYAGATSSRSSKLAHGGLRYLAYADFKQVLDGVRAREELFHSAPHLVHPQRFMIPIAQKLSWPAIKYGAGLKIYDFFLRDRSRRHRWRDAAELGELNTALGRPIAGVFEYSDGIMDDARLVMATITAAREEGALCLNYAEVVHVLSQRQGQVLIAVKDGETGATLELEAGIVMNCAGPWVAEVGRAGKSEGRNQVRLSRGSHLLFPTPWPHPALFLETVGGSSAYFVLPHPAGMMLGTTERAVERPEKNPEPAIDELEELCTRMQQDLPGMNLRLQDAHYCFAGLRTLPHTGGAKSLSAVSRRPRWNFQHGMLTLLGGKYTTAALTAYEGLEHVFQLAELGRRPVPVLGRRLSGAPTAEATEAFVVAAAERGIPEIAQQRALQRFGSWCGTIAEIPEWLEVMPGGIVRGEIELACLLEQARTVSDVLRRRLGEVYLKGHGVELIPGVVEVLAGYRSGNRAAAEEAEYREHLERVKGLLQTRS